MRILLILLVAVRASAFTPNDGARTMVTDGSPADMQAAEDYIVNKAQPNWVTTEGAVNGRYNINSLVTFQNTNFNVISGANGSIWTNKSGVAVNWIFACSAYPNYTVISNMTWTTDGTHPSSTVCRITGPGMCFRFSGMTLLNMNLGTTFAVTIGTAGGALGPYGVVDHCTVTDSGAGSGIFALHDNGANSWTQPMTWGTTSAVVFENCTATAANNANTAGYIDGYDGCRWVYRYSAMTNYNFGVHGQNTGPGVGNLQAEVYSNAFAYPYQGGSFAFVFNLRGGTMVFYNTDLYTFGTAALASFIQLWDECGSTQWAAEHCPSQLMYPADYPSIEQVGQGVVGGVQGSVPVYGWNNGLHGGPGVLFNFWQLGLDAADAPFIQQGRDVFTNSIKSGYSPLVYPHPLVSQASQRIARATNVHINNAHVGP